jgi:uncharacterized protein with ATP-grasp and redox domains
MSPSQHPSIPLPAPLRGADRGSFAEQTIRTRLPGIARRTAVEHDWPADIQAALIALADELPHGLLRPLSDGGLDAPAWEHYLADYLGLDWLAPPWFVVETYFFRRILEASGYFQPGSGERVDPYTLQKQRGLQLIGAALRPFYARVEALLQSPPGDPARYQEPLAELLRLAIWGNQVDLSMWPAGEGGQINGPSDGHQEAACTHALLCDQANQAAGHLISGHSQVWRVDFILDNSGVELAFDLGLARFLLDARLAERVYFHVKPYPTYVSDATAADVNATIAYLAGATNPVVRRTGERLRQNHEQGRLRLITHHFWVSPLCGWDLPADLRLELSKSTLLVNKGDANYRRWLGDRHWPYTTPLAEILNYLPVPWLALRILKANMAAGLPPGAAEAAAKQDPHWLHSGHWGVIQFVNPSE